MSDFLTYAYISPLDFMPFCSNILCFLYLVYDLVYVKHIHFKLI